MVTRPALVEVAVPERYKSAADGDDWLPAFLRAQAVGRIVQLRPDTTYELSGAVRNVSHRLWRGAGPSTVVTVDQGNANAAERAAFMLGNQHPAAFAYTDPTVNQFPSYDLEPVAAGDVTATLATAGDAAAFAVGQFVWVRHVTEVVAGGINYPLYAQITKVRAIAGAVIELDDPVLEAIPSACLAPIGATVDAFMGYPFETVEGVTIQDLTVAGSRGLMSTRTGAYRCHIRDVAVTGGEYLVSAQAWVGCSAERIAGVVSDRLIEVKDYSQDCDYRQIVGRIAGAGANTPIGLGEQSNRQRFAGVRCVVPSEHTAVVPLATLNGWLNVLRDCEMIHAGSASGQPVVSIPSNLFAGYGPNRNRIEGGRIVANASRSHHVIIGSSGATADPTGTVIDGVEFVGATSGSKSVKIANGGIAGRIENCALPFPLEISTGATAPSESGNAYAGVSGGTMHAGAASPLGSISAESGAIFQRRGATTDAYPAYLKTGATANAGWLRLLTMSGLSVRGDADVTVSTATGAVQVFAADLTADRYVTLPAPSAADPGWPFEVWKTTAGGVGKLGVKNAGGAVLREIAAGSTGVVLCRWDGTGWQTLALVAT